MAAFRAIRNKGLAAAGLGETGVDTTLAGNTLLLRGGAGERLDMPLAAITQLRAGYEQNRYSGKLYRMSLWTSAAPRPLTLATVHADEADYAMIARAIGDTVERTHGPGAIEGGLGWVDALRYPLWVSIGMIVSTLAAYADQSGSHRESLLTTALMMSAIWVPILGMIMWFFFRPYRPRRLITLSELDQFLPGQD
ncbi:MAG: hypothetical protein ABIO86_04870 [Sphingomonas sp.]